MTTRWVSYSQYGNSSTLDLGLIRLTVSYAIRARSEPSGYIWRSSTGHRSRDGLYYATPQIAQDASEKWLRAKLAELQDKFPIEPKSKPRPSHCPAHPWEALDGLMGCSLCSEE